MHRVTVSRRSSWLPITLSLIATLVHSSLCRSLERFIAGQVASGVCIGAKVLDNTRIGYVRLYNVLAMRISTGQRNGFTVKSVADQLNYVTNSAASTAS